MKVIFTCGGTAGHVNPALALAGYMEKKHPDLQVLFVGTPTGMEKDLVAKAGYEFRGIPVSGFNRRINLENIRHNVGSVKNLMTAPARARAILREFQPDLVVGTGGYASYPMVKYAAKAGIPTAVHESNMVPGLTTKVLEEFADRVMVGFEECRQLYKHPEKIVVTGTPVRGDFFELTRQQAREQLGLEEGRKLVVSFWGSLGASGMNAQMMDFFRREVADGMPFAHIHAAGSGSWESMEQQLQQEGLWGTPGLDVRQYIHDMAVVMRAADLVICRAGASTISEITALAVPAIMVPSPYVTNNHQEKNARILAHHGGAHLLLESESTGEKLYETARSILSSPTHWESMSRGMAQLGILDATERIYDTVMQLVK
ncbi:MAG: undecaprenyldiphospho-muramoylpentapeptide beta-N-acetylglucosaminyltransferase [Ruminococcaceae bacterium]|nr:undecaprenyldiphospho-muramoylpentapeptide beta-N-acetylglucosaminyltransferase [Oscillospiraceae bacterium]